MYNNQMNQMPGMMMGGMQYNQQQAKMTQPLTKEEMAKLQTTGNAKLVVNEMDILRAKCTHKRDGQLALVPNSDGSHTCTVCGATFNLVDADVSDVHAITRRFIDILQSIKTFYLDMPANYASEFFVMIPLLENTPELYKIALHQFAKYENGNVVNSTNPMYGFGLLNTLTSPGYGMMNGMQQPMMGGMQQQMPGYDMNQMQMQQQMGMMNPMMGGMQQPMMNGMQQPMMPGMNPFTMQQNQMQQTAQQIDNQVAQQNEIQNNNSNQVTTTKTFNV